MSTAALGRTPTAPRGDPYVLEVSDAAYRVVWALVMAFHALLSALLARACYSLYRTLRHPLLVVSVIGATGIEFHASIVYLSVLCSFAVIAVDVYEIARACRLSLRARKLTLLPYELARPPPPCHVRPSRSVLATVEWLAFRVQHLRWAIGTRGPYFQASYHLREALEVALQTAQAFRLSFVVTHDWTNHLAVAVIVLNCWSSPLLYWAFRRSAARRRLSCLAVDVVLDFTSSLVVPYSIYAKYRAMLPQLDLYDPIWVHQTSNDMQQFTNLSLFDVSFRLASAVSLLLSLQTVQAIIRRRRSPLSSPPLAASASIVPSPLPPAPVLARAKSSGPRASPQRPPRRRWLAIAHGLFVAYGVAVLTVFALATYRPAGDAVAGCQLATRRWLATQHPCAVLEINCHARGFVGSSEELTRALDTVDARSLSSLVVSHCPQLSVPPAVRRFPNLVWLELYNSTLVDWPAAARPSRASSPVLSRILLIRVRFATAVLPAGLLPPAARAYPPALKEIVVVRATALPSLPRNLSAHWDPRRLRALVLEDCALERVPRALDSFRLATLSLAYNALTELPAWLFTRRDVPYARFSAAGNPLAALPAALDGPNDSPFAPLADARAAFKGVFLDATNVSELPAWALDAGLCTLADVSAAGAPLCGPGGQLRTRTQCAAGATHCEAVFANAASAADGGRLFPLARHDARRRLV